MLRSHRKSSKSFSYLRDSSGDSERLHGSRENSQILIKNMIFDSLDSSLLSSSCRFRVSGGRVSGGLPQLSPSRLFLMYLTGSGLHDNLASAISVVQNATTWSRICLFKLRNQDNKSFSNLTNLLTKVTQ